MEVSYRTVSLPVQTPACGGACVYLTQHTVAVLHTIRPAQLREPTRTGETHDRAAVEHALQLRPDQLTEAQRGPVRRVVEPAPRRGLSSGRGGHVPDAAPHPRSDRSEHARHVVHFCLVWAVGVGPLPAAGVATQVRQSELKVNSAFHIQRPPGPGPLAAWDPGPGGLRQPACQKCQNAKNHLTRHNTSKRTTSPPGGWGGPTGLPKIISPDTGNENSDKSYLAGSHSDLANAAKILQFGSDSSLYPWQPGAWSMCCGGPTGLAKNLITGHGESKKSDKPHLERSHSDLSIAANLARNQLPNVIRGAICFVSVEDRKHRFRQAELGTDLWLGYTSHITRH
eukprot:gene22858-biopygen7238